MFTNYRALHHVHQEDRDAFMEIYKVASWISYYEGIHKWGSWPCYNCHSICRALAKIFPKLVVVDGCVVGIRRISRKSGAIELKFGYYPHSWLVGPKGSIIDPYPVGSISQPLLIPTRGDLTAFGAGLYIPDPRLTPNFTKPKILRLTEALIEHIRKLMVKSKKCQAREIKK